jgi:hypothetical protein
VCDEDDILPPSPAHSHNEIDRQREMRGVFTLTVLSSGSLVTPNESSFGIETSPGGQSGRSYVLVKWKRTRVTRTVYLPPPSRAPSGPRRAPHTARAPLGSAIPATGARRDRGRPKSGRDAAVRLSRRVAVVQAKTIARWCSTAPTRARTSPRHAWHRHPKTCLPGRAPPPTAFQGTTPDGRPAQTLWRCR